MDRQIQPIRLKGMDRYTMSRAGSIIAGMADTIADMSEKIERMEKEFSRMIPLTGAQERDVQSRIRAKAEEICALYGLPPEARRTISRGLRSNLKRRLGVCSIREIPRIDYELALEEIELWDDYQTVREARKAHG